MIYLKYGTEDPQAFKELDYRSRPNRSAINGETLRGNLFDHTLFKRRIWSITISANAIDTQAKLDFLESFFTTDLQRQLSFNGTDYVDVMLAPGEMPLEYVQNIRLLPKVTFVLTRRQAVATRISGESPM